MAKKRRPVGDVPAESIGRFHVALIIESSRGYGRGVLWGIARWVRTHGPGSISRQDRGLAEPVPPWLNAWSGHGMIVRVTQLGGTP
jgi:LacI family transcriptional regulator